MRTLELGDLGQIAMLQTIVVVVGFVQLGLINGGYRLYAGADSSSGSQINNAVMTNLASLSLLLLSAVLMLQFIGGFSIPNVESETLLIGCFIGVAMMGATWVNNTLIAQGKLGISSVVNLSASATSLLVAIAPGPDKYEMALLAIILQPICLFVLALVIHPPSRPSIAVDGKLTRRIIEIGFAPYCAGIVALTNFQIERWFIVAELGGEAVGKYYLSIVYWTIFSLVPISLLNLFYPKTVSAYDRRDKQLFNTLVRKHMYVLLSYIVTAVILTYAFLPWALESYLKYYSEQKKIVYLIMPGLIAYVLFDNVVLILQSAKKMTNIFLFTIIALGLNFLMLVWLSASNFFTLELVAALKSVSFVVAAVVIVADIYIRRGRLLSWN